MSDYSLQRDFREGGLSGYLVCATALWCSIYSIYTRIIHKAPLSGVSVFFVRKIELERE